jgi:hypothetical protein
MDKRLNPEQTEAVIEDALHTFPLAPLPRDLTAEVMARIKASPAPRPFRLTWNEIALGIVLALCVGALWTSLQFLPPLLVMQIRMQGILLYQDMVVLTRSLTPVLFFGVAAFLSALTIPYLSRQLMK